MTVPNNIAASARTVEQVLTHLEGSFQQGGFESALPVYQKMGDTILNQCLWTRRGPRSAELDELYKAIACRARALYSLLGPYADLMRRLATIDAIGEDETSSQAEDPILQLLSHGEMSVTALRSKVGHGNSDVRARLDKLEQQGRIASRVASGRRLYRIL